MFEKISKTAASAPSRLAPSPAPTSRWTRFATVLVAAFNAAAWGAGNGSQELTPSANDDATVGGAAHFAVISCGSTHGSAQHQEWYWNSNERIYRMLTEVYRYPAECVYRLHEEGKSKDPAVDGRSSLVNFRRVFAHLAEIMKKDDHLFVYIVGHGGPGRGDYVYDLTDGKLSATEFARMLDALPSRNVVVVANPCHSGALIAKLSSKGRVICTSTKAEEGNAAGWEGYMTGALARREGTDTNGDGRVSLKEAYNASIDGTIQWYRKKGLSLREHPLLDDNGDGVGHFGKDPVVEGDGSLAAGTFLGDGGKELRYEESTLETVRQANRRLTLD
jgi:hypothetical protein